MISRSPASPSVSTTADPATHRTTMSQSGDAGQQTAEQHHAQRQDVADLDVRLYRLTGQPNVQVGDVLALCMMLLGGLLTCVAAWLIIIEMRGRVRMVDTLAKTGEREIIAAPHLPILEAPLETRPVEGNMMATEAVGARPSERATPARC